MSRPLRITLCLTTITLVVIVFLPKVRDHYSIIPDSVRNWWNEKFSNFFKSDTPIRPKRPTFTSRELMKDPSFRKKTMRDLHRRISAAVTQYHQKTPFEMKTTWESYFGLTELTLSPALEIDESQLEENSTVNSLIDKYQETDNEIVNSLIKSVKIQEESSSLMKQILKDIRVLRAILREPDENSSDM